MPSEPRPSVRHALLYTPLSDFLRGHAPGRLDARHAIASFDLPENLEHAVLRVARQTRLRRRERVAVAEDLAEHMRDGLDMGTPAETLLSDFGDEATAAQLIRRSMVRKRSHLARLPRYAVKGTILVTSSVILLALITWTYLGMQIWFASPQVTVNYVDQLNKQILATPEEDSAWPGMQEIEPQVDQLALQQLGWSGDVADTAPEDIELARTYVNALLGRASEIVWHESMWPEEAKSTDAHVDLHTSVQAHIVSPLEHIISPLEQRGVDPQIANPESRQAIDSFFQRATPVLSELRALTQMPALRCEILMGSQPDSTLYHARTPALSDIRRINQRLLLGDLLYAVKNKDSQRTLEDIEALLGLARLTREQGFLISQLLAHKLERSAFKATGDILAVDPDFFDDQQLTQLASMLALPNERLEISMEQERLLFEDVAQRIYSSNGQLLPNAFKLVKDLSIGPMPPGIDSAVVAPFALALAPSRAEALETWHTIMDHYEALSRSHENDEPKLTREVDLKLYIASYNPPHTEDWSLLAQYKEFSSHFPLNVLIPGLSTVSAHVRTVKQERDAARLAIALEQWRRVHGNWPERLDQLIPDHLAQLPQDQFDGQLLRYRLPGNRPLIYSVGRDGQDDAGTPNPTPDVYSEGWDIILWNGPSMK